MAIQPPSDLVLDVSKAADPLEYRASVEKLRNAQSAVRAANLEMSGEGFSQLAKAGGDTSVSSVTGQYANQVKIKEKSPNSDHTEAYKKFEAFMLQTFIQNMFTTDTPSVFGKGQAGEYWKSMMAESMAKEVADRGGIGVAKMLARDEELKQGKVPDGGIQGMGSAFGDLARTNQNTQATVDNIVHSHDINFVRKQMTENT